MSGNKVIRYRNCQVLRGGVLESGDIWVRDGQVIDPMVLFYQERHQPEVTIECNELIASPGFIDLQVNGIINGWIDGQIERQMDEWMNWR